MTEPRIAWKREAAGSYASQDGRFTIAKAATANVVHGVLVIREVLGASSEPWDLKDGGEDAGAFRTLRDAKAEAERRGGKK